MPTGIAQTVPETCRVSVYENSFVTYDTRMKVSDLQILFPSRT